MRWLACVLLLVLMGGGGGSAHPLSHSLSRLEVEGRAVRVTLTLDLLELGDVDRDGDQRVAYDELDAAIARVYARIRDHFQVRGDTTPGEATLERYAIVDDGHIGRFEMRLSFATPPTLVDVTSTLDRVTTPEHRHLTSLAREDGVDEAILDRSRPTVRFEPGRRSLLRTAWRFLWLGVEHIATGYDHLAFLVCLLIGASGARSLVLVVTSFTLAHSLTLALATFELVALPPALIESLIALSIAYVAAENLLGVQVVARYRITFLFGLIHGFGFSNVLRDMALPRANLAWSLFSFNAGVEVGQLIFVLALLPVMAYLNAARAAVVRAAVSLAVFGLAVYWFVERAWLA